MFVASSMACVNAFYELSNLKDIAETVISHYNWLHRDS